MDEFDLSKIFVFCCVFWHFSFLLSFSLPSSCSSKQREREKEREDLLEKLFSFQHHHQQHHQTTTSSSTTNKQTTPTKNKKTMAQSNIKPNEQTMASSKDHSLSLKVMRLPKPSFKPSPTTPSTFETTDIPGDPLLSKSMSLQDDFPLSQTLVLPQNFGTIYSGESFRGYLSLHNISPFDVTSVTVKAHLQTPSARHTLLEEPPQNIPSFGAGNAKDYIVSYTVVEDGMHVLVCASTYTRYDGEKKTLRKYYKFLVEKPFTTKNRNFLLDDNNLFCEVQIQNAMKAPLYIHSVSFVPSPPLQVLDLNDPSEEEKETSEMFVSGLFCMNNGSSRSYVYKLSHGGGGGGGGGSMLRNFGRLGAVEIEWRSTLGEKAKQSIEVFQKKQLDHQRDLEVSLSSVPERIIAEQPFSVECSITNLGKMAISPRLLFVKSKMTGVMINGVSGQSLGHIPPHSVKKFTLQLFPLLPGVQQVSGVRIEEKGQKYDFDNLLQIFVKTVNMEE